jgi:long-chain acyl-CoA synthetase
MKRTVLNLLTQATEKFPQSNYLSEKSDSGWISKTYADINKESDIIASGLIEKAFGNQDKIAILSEGRIDWVTAEYGILKAGCIAVPLSVKLLPEELLFRLNHSESHAIFISRHQLNKLEPILSKIKSKKFSVICFDADTDTAKKLDKLKNKKTDIVYFKDLYNSGSENLDNHKDQLTGIIKNIKENDTVTISYTSGTTGNPKGIMLSHLNYHSNSINAWEYFKLPLHYKTLIILPLDHSFAHTVGIYISLVCALNINFVDGRGGPVQTLKNIPVNLKEVQPDFLLTVPSLTGSFMNKIKEGIDNKGGIAKSLFNAGLKTGQKLYRDGFRKEPVHKRIFDYIPYSLANAVVFKKVRQIFGGNLKFCIGGGALLDIKQQQFFYALGVPVFQGYGLTEATPIISTNCVHTHKLGTSGQVIYGVECKILRADGSEAEKEEKGEIVIRGNNVMKGYYKNPEATAETIKDNWLYTGDMGFIDKDDFLIVAGRVKALLISDDGEKYSPESIEEAITNTSDLIFQTMVYNDHEKYTTALITLHENKIKAYIQENEIRTPEELLEDLTTSFFAFKEEEAYTIPPKWIPRIFRILKEPFTEDNKMLNSTMKMVRPNVTETYKHILDELYSRNAPEENKAKNIETLKSFFL